MEIDSPEDKAFLFELYTQTNGNTDEQVSMYDVGQSLGLDKAQAGSTAENLFVQGFAELKTLSGGIGITRQGLLALNINVGSDGTRMHKLSAGPVLNPDDISCVEAWVPEIKEAISKLGFSHEKMEEFIFDIKCVDLQMLSPKPKTGVIKELIRSLKNNLPEERFSDLIFQMGVMIE